jgi:S1-C subfamily serine protease
MIASNPGVGQSAGIGFAIPINTAKAVLNDLITLGRVRRPVLGVFTLAIGPISRTNSDCQRTMVFWCNACCLAVQLNAPGYAPGLSAHT